MASVAAEVVRGMTLAAWLGVVVGVGALIFAWLAWRVSKQELHLAQEEAELRPKLVLSFKTCRYHPRPRDPGTEYPHAVIVFNVTNEGRSAAHYVQCEVRFDERHLIPDDMYGANPDFDRPRFGPTATEPHQINVAVLAHGPTEARYRFVCDEVGESEGTVEFTIPERQRDGN